MARNLLLYPADWQLYRPLTQESIIRAAGGRPPQPEKEDPMKELSRSVIGTTTGPQTFEYTWRDCAIYALGVGAGRQSPPASRKPDRRF